MIGLINPARRTLALKGRHCQWLCDGAAFLEHLSELSAIKCVARCRRCLSAHAVGHLDATRPHYHIACACRPRGADVFVDQPLEVAPLLLTLGWEIVCAACGDAVRGDNDQTAARFTVECACTTRDYRLTVH